ncbi:MAG: CpXC domain-containing protein [Anaerolineae bacterium]
MSFQQVMPVNCPSCNARFTAPIENIINGQDVSLKTAFLQGVLNVIRCPQCGFSGMASVPVLYYDLEKELALVHVPTDLSMMGDTQEKIIGDLTNRLFNSLPAEQKKFYLLNPTTFLTLDSLMKAILAADGITEEVLQAQEARMKLIEEFLKSPSEAALKAKVKEHDAQLDREFFETLTANLQTAQMAGDQQRAQTFLTLRTLISRWSSNGKKIVAEIDREMGLLVMESQEDLLSKLQTAQSNEEFEALVAAGHGFMDYSFFQQLTAKIDQAAQSGAKAEAETLRNLRNRILETKSRQEEQSKQALEESGKILEAIFKSRQPEKVIEEHLEQINEAFFFLVQANIDEARRQGHNDAAQALEMIGAMALAKLQEKYGEPPQQAAEPQPQTKPTIEIASR